MESLEDITSRIQDLSTNRGDAARRSQKERAELKATFRVIQSSMEGGDVPTQKIKLRHGDVLVIDALVPSIQLNAFRRFLAEGFQAHMQASCCWGVRWVCVVPFMSSLVWLLNQRVANQVTTTHADNE